MFLRFLYVLCHLSLMKRSRLNLCCIEALRSRDLWGNEVSKCGASFFWCRTLPCFEHHCGVNFFCILVYIVMVVSLKEHSWVRVWNFYMSCLISSWKAFEWWKCHTCNVFGDFVSFHSAALYAWDHKIFPENQNCSAWYHITYFFPGPLCNYNTNSVWIA